MHSSAKTIGLALVLTVIAVSPLAHASHKIFSFDVDRFEVDGNSHGAHDGVADVVDEFDDGNIAPGFYSPFGTVVESGGLLTLKNPGFHAPSPFGGIIDFSLVATSQFNVIQGGAGDATATSYWIPTIPALGESYHFTLFVTAAVNGFQQLMGVGVANRAGVLELEQHRTDLNQQTFAYQNAVFDFEPFDAGDVTGMIGLRLVFDDATQLVTGAFSLDGGATWAMPFPSRQLSDMASHGAQLLISADPDADGGGGTTTTTVATSTTTTTTFVPGLCDPTSCRRGVVPFASKLVVKDKANDRGDTIKWKLRRGEATAASDFGDPATDTTYEICMQDGTGATLYVGLLLGGANCDGRPCWKRTGQGGWKFSDPNKLNAGIGTVVLKPGSDGAAQVLVKARGIGISMPTLPIQNLPVSVRLTATNGECWATVFGTGGVGTNIPALLKAVGD